MKNKEYYSNLGKHDLLEEMALFQIEKSKIGKLTPELINQGIILFEELVNQAETQGFQILTASYLRHLKQEKNKLNPGLRLVVNNCRK